MNTNLLIISTILENDLEECKKIATRRLDELLKEIKSLNLNTLKNNYSNYMQIVFDFASLLEKITRKKHKVVLREVFTKVYIVLETLLLLDDVSYIYDKWKSGDIDYKEVIATLNSYGNSSLMYCKNVLKDLFEKTNYFGKKEIIESYLL